MKSVLSLSNRFRGFHTLMISALQILLSVLLYASCQAQSDPAGEYNFSQMSVADGSGDTVVNLTMDCLAANGYGQWTASSETTGPHGSFPEKGWFLLGNAIKPNVSTSSPSIVPPGIVAKGVFSGPYRDGMKVVANLKGSVRYVAVEPIFRVTFEIDGLNDAFAANGSHLQNIDISLDGFPNPPIKRQIVQRPSTPYGSVNMTSDGTFTHAVVSEAKSQDNLDAACDAKWLYIVWATTSNIGTSTKEIWATAVNLNTGTVATGFPIKISTGTANDKFPTVACDVRANPTNPKFVVSYISGGTAITCADVNNTTITSNTLSAFFIPPTGSPTPTLPYTTPTHARVVRSSVFNSSPTATFVYAIVHASGTTDLILQDGLTVNAPAMYVDGERIAPPSPLIAHTLPSNPGNTIIDNPIVAFANPYDNQNQTGSTPFTQFHALYQCTTPARSPLCMARYAFNGSTNQPSGAPIAGGGDTRVILNQASGALLANDPTGFPVAAANQMGIHVHWRTSAGDHFYSRDLNRTFDEDIEENTLVTYTCKVANGSTAHGGSATPRVLPNVTMTLWTDPNWVLPTTIGGGTDKGYQWIGLTGGNIGILSFDGSGVKLLVGDNPVGVATGGAVFAMSPVTVCLFSSATTQGITINAASIFEYHGSLGLGGGLSIPSLYLSRNFYGGNPVGQSPFQGSLWGAGSGIIELNGKSAQLAKLNLHGGTWFEIHGAGSFVSNFGQIESMFESDIIPTWVTATTPQGADYFPISPVNQAEFMNPPASGRMLLSGATTIDHTTVISHDVNITGLNQGHDDIITIIGNSSNTTNTSITNSTFTNSGSTWLGSSSFNGNAVNPGKGRVLFYKTTGFTDYNESSVSDNSFNGWQLAYQNPVNPVTISSCNFSNVREAALLLNRDRSLEFDYDHILISGCDFTTFRYPATDYTPIPGSDFGIYISGFDESLMVGTESDPDYHSRIYLLGNTFTTTTGLSSGAIDAAIYLDQSSVSAQGNTIDKSAYTYGIHNVGKVAPSAMTSLSFLCSNTISNSSSSGIYTSSWGGYSKLNNVSGCGIGHSSDGDVIGAGVVFCNIHDNTGPGLYLTSSSKMDISGVHTGGNNYAGFNTFKYNNTQSSSSTSGQIELTAGVDLKIGTTSTSSSTFGQNNFISNGSTDNLFYAPLSSGVTLGGIDENYWGYGSTPTTVTLLGTSDGLLPNITYSVTSGGSNPLCRTSQSSFSGVTCGVGFGESIKSKDNSLSIMADPVFDSCQFLQDRMWSIGQSGNYQVMYDSARIAIEKCGTINGLFPHIWSDFGVATSGCQYMSKDKARFATYLDWLKKVLYLNPDTFYYCSDVKAMFLAFNWFNDQRGYDINGGLAVMKFLMDSNKCLGIIPDLNKNWADARNEQYQFWKDTVGDWRGKSPDTTLPTLEDLDLEILRGPQYAAVKNAFTPSTSKKIVSLSASENPFTDETTLRFALSDKEYIKVELYDLLGKVVYSDGGLFTEGDGSLRIEGKGIPRGHLYARLSTMGGEVLTIALVKQ
jgi:hypothetical protein